MVCRDKGLSILALFTLNIMKVDLNTLFAVFVRDIFISKMHAQGSYQADDRLSSSSEWNGASVWQNAFEAVSVQG